MMWRIVGCVFLAIGFCHPEGKGFLFWLICMGLAELEDIKIAVKERL